MTQYLRAMEVRDRFGTQNLTLTERPLPTPQPKQALIRLKATSLNYRDLLMVEGQYNPRQPLPLIPCSDGVGEVIAVGEGCALSIGTRVAPIFSQSWWSGEPTTQITQSTLGGPLDGTLSTHICLDESGLVEVPSYLTDAEAGTLGCAALTAWSALVELGQLKSGARVLCIGTGGVSLFAAQIALTAGAEVILCSRSQEKLERVQSFGLNPQHLIHTPKNAHWGKTIRTLSGGGVDHVIEVGGAQTLSQSLTAVRPGGVISLIGILSGVSAPLNLLPILMRQVRVQGVIVGHREGFKRMLRAFDLHQIHPVISATYALEEAKDAFRHLSRSAHIGKISVTL